MCVICVKPKDCEFPSDERMAQMFSANSDGAGFMYVREGKVEIRKGFMKMRHFRRGLKREGLTPNDIVIMHFRIGTAGSNTPKNTHPFPITDNLKDLRALRLSTDIAMAHNGMLSYGGDKTNDLSDTMAFVREVLSHKPIRESIFDLPTFTLIEHAIGSSKMVFMNGVGDFVLLGDWKTATDKTDKCYYSNLNFEPTTSVYYGREYTKQYPVYGYVKKPNGEWELSNTYAKDTKASNVVPLIPATTPPAKHTKIDWDALTEDEWRELRLQKDMEEQEKTFATTTARPHANTDYYNNAVFVDYDDTECPRCKYQIESLQRINCSKCGVFFYRPHEMDYYGGY